MAKIKIYDNDESLKIALLGKIDFIPKEGLRRYVDGDTMYLIPISTENGETKIKSIVPIRYTDVEIPAGIATMADLIAWIDAAVETTDLDDIVTLLTDIMTAIQIIDDWDRNDSAKVQGSIAHDSPNTQYPVVLGGQASATKPTAVADGDAVRAYFDTFGRQHVVDDGGGASAGGGNNTYSTEQGDFTAVPTSATVITITYVNRNLILNPLTEGSFVNGILKIKDVSLAVDEWKTVKLDKFIWTPNATTRLTGELDISNCSDYFAMEFGAPPNIDIVSLVVVAKDKTFVPTLNAISTCESLLSLVDDGSIKWSNRHFTSTWASNSTQTLGGAVPTVSYQEQIRGVIVYASTGEKTEYHNGVNGHRFQVSSGILTSYRWDYSTSTFVAVDIFASTDLKVMVFIGQLTKDGYDSSSDSFKTQEQSSLDYHKYDTPLADNVAVTTGGAGCTLNVTATNGIVSGIGAIVAGGTNYVTGDILRIESGDYNAYVKVTAAAGVVSAAAIVQAGTGYVTGTPIATSKCTFINDTDGQDNTYRNITFSGYIRDDDAQIDLIVEYTNNTDLVKDWSTAGASGYKLWHRISFAEVADNVTIKEVTCTNTTKYFSIALEGFDFAKYRFTILSRSAGFTYSAMYYNRTL